MRFDDCCTPAEAAEAAGSRREPAAADGRPLVEVLSFDGCPNRDGALELVERVARETGVDARIDVIDVTDDETARARRFLGSPTILVAGRDVEPGAEERSDYAVSCRVYRTGDGLRGLPDEIWLRAALAAAAAP
ncbi:hypothetical protein Gocc_1235 [Gaiella occulta]|uniref:Thioredoxin family protein n=1 Tax=Gaiella occulta TaxID=1002870 RepID=A0A7M2YZ59_9ACTN|nr:thioredoxin family protein [Gaiella occulta]RDI75437.1 hypothetical protein Gocc_1235 [Gaiella occulta]